MVVWLRRDGVKGNWPFCIQFSAAPTDDKSQRSKPSTAGVSRPLLLLFTRQLFLNKTGRTNGNHRGSVHPEAQAAC